MIGLALAPTQFAAAVDFDFMVALLRAEQVMKAVNRSSCDAFSKSTAGFFPSLALHCWGAQESLVDLSHLAHRKSTYTGKIVAPENLQPKAIASLAYT